MQILKLLIINKTNWVFEVGRSVICILSFIFLPYVYLFFFSFFLNFSSNLPKKMFEINNVYDKKKNKKKKKLPAYICALNWLIGSQNDN